MDRRRKGKTGLSLVELLIVIGIIATISAVSIPVIARSGLFTSNKSQLAARELFIVLRAAKIYATTHNVETAVAYGGLLVDDSFSGETVPVVDSMTVVRRFKRKEMAELIQAGALPGFSVNDSLFVQVKEGNSNFKRMPNGTCILPDVFAVDDGANFSTTGLTDVVIFDPVDAQFLAPRTWFCDDDIDKDNPIILSYALSSDPNAFPAHRFSPEGALLVADALPQQRFRFRVGILPSAEPADRFFLNVDEFEFGTNHKEDIPAVFHNPDCENLDSVTILHDPDRPVSEQTGFQQFDTPIDIDVDIFLYVPTGRVKVGS